VTHSPWIKAPHSDEVCVHATSISKLTRLGLNVRRRREAVGLPQETLAEKADLDRAYVGGIERGFAQEQAFPLRRRQHFS
jgi:ribosome-binding protein aMBF1 (putative translation factor)